MGSSIHDKYVYSLFSVNIPSKIIQPAHQEDQGLDAARKTVEMLVHTNNRYGRGCRCYMMRTPQENELKLINGIPIPVLLPHFLVNVFRQWSLKGFP